MTGQLNNSLLSSNSAGLQCEIDCLDTRVTQAENNISTNTTNIDKVSSNLDSWKESMADTVVSTNVKATEVNADSVDSTKADISCAEIDNATITSLNNTTLKGNVVTAQSVSAPNISGTTVVSTTVKATTVNADTVESAGNVVGSIGSFTTVDADNIIAGDVKADAISGSFTGNVTSTKAIITNANIDNLTVGTEASIQSAVVENANISTVDAKSITTDNITSTTSNQTTTTIDNLTVNKTLCLGENVSIGANFGDATADSLSTDKLVVNGDSTLNGEVVAGSVTVGDGKVVAGEYCIGTKGIVIDKDKNVTASNVTADSVTANTVNATDGTSNFDQLCVTTTTECNAFVNNLYPTNITTDKNVGCLHYSRQLDTDNTGDVLVDCKNVYPKEVKCSCYYLQSYCDREGYCQTDDEHLNQFKRLGGICLDTNACRDCTGSSAKYDNGICMYTCINDTYGELEPGCSPKTNYTKGFCIKTVSGDTDTLSISAFDNNVTYPIISADFCSGCYCDLTVCNPTTFKCDVCFDGTISLKCVPYCSTATTCILALDSDKKLVSQEIRSSLIESDCCSIENDCYTYYNCIYQNPGNCCEYTVRCECRENNDYCIATTCRNQTCDSLTNVIRLACCCKSSLGITAQDDKICLQNYYRDEHEKLEHVCTYIDCNSNVDCEYLRYCSYDNHYYNTLCISTCCISCHYCPSDSCCNTCVAHISTLCGSILPACDSTSPSYVYRQSYYLCEGKCYPSYDTSWCLCLDKQNVYLKNPIDNTDIFRVEDGKIYTKCGEFSSGGSAGASITYCSEDTVRTLCIDNTVATNDCNLTLSNSVYASLFANKKASSYYGYALTTEDLLCNGAKVSNSKYTTCYTDSACEPYEACKIYVENEVVLPRVDSRRISTYIVDNFYYSTSCSDCRISNGCVMYYKEKFCPSFKVSDCCGNTVSSYCFADNSIVCFDNAGLYLEKSTDDLATRIFLGEEGTSDCIYRIYSSCTMLSDIFTGVSENRQTCEDYCILDLDFNNRCTNNFIGLGESADIISYTSGDYSFEGCYNYTLLGKNVTIHEGCAKVCANEYDSGSYEKCVEIICGTTWDILYKGVDNCITATCGDGTSFTYCNRIDANGLKESFGGLCVITKCNSKDIECLPVTNAIVPLAGVVNNKGFAFFCKSTSGVSFYDYDFNSVDAGTDTSICYTVTTGIV